MNYSLGRKKSSVEQANSIIQSLLKSALNIEQYKIFIENLKDEFRNKKKTARIAS